MPSNGVSDEQHGGADLNTGQAKPNDKPPSGWTAPRSPKDPPTPPENGKSQRDWNKVIAYATTVYAIVAGVTLVVLFFQLQEAARQSESSRRTMLFNARALEEANRAYLHMTSMPVGRIEPNKAGAFKFKVKNSGQRTANKVTEILCGAVVAKRGVRPEVKNANEEAVEHASIDPNQSSGEYSVPYQVFSAEQVEEMSSGNGQQLYVYGIIRYEDDFRVRCLQYCKVWPGYRNGDWLHCPFELPLPAVCDKSKLTDQENGERNNEAGPTYVRDQ